ncbi:MAG: 50S ribosomal protein L29 [Actinomycetes bacterium]
MSKFASAQELREMEPDELSEHAAGARRELFDLRFRSATGELEDTASLNAARRHVARTITVCLERGITISKESTK